MKTKVLIKYKVQENDSDWMSSQDLENEEHTIEIQNKNDVVEFLKSLEFVSLNKEILKELEEDSDFVVGPDLDKYYNDREDIGWVSTDSSLVIKAVK